MFRIPFERAPFNSGRWLLRSTFVATLVRLRRGAAELAVVSGPRRTFSVHVPTLGTAGARMGRYIYPG